MEKYGCCRFCGQIEQPDLLTDMSEREHMTADELNEQATLRCNCYGATMYRATLKRKQKAMENVAALFGESAPKDKRMDEEIVNLLFQVVEMLCDSDSLIERMSLNVWGGVRATLSRNSKGEIKVERQETQKQQLIE